jgi:hypothetical protein
MQMRPTSLGGALGQVAKTTVALCVSRGMAGPERRLPLGNAVTLG